MNICDFKNREVFKAFNMQKLAILSSSQIFNNFYSPEDSPKPGSKQKSCHQSL